MVERQLPKPRKHDIESLESALAHAGTRFLIRDGGRLVDRCRPESTRNVVQAFSALLAVVTDAPCYLMDSCKRRATASTDAP